MSTYKSYIDRFARSKSTKREASSDPKLSTDKEAYTQFLEIQLERISQAILQVDSFNDKLESVSLQVNSLEEKLSNSNKLVKFLQSFADGQEADNVKVQEKINEVTKKQNDFANVIERRYARFEDLDALTQRLKELEKKGGQGNHEHDTHERFTTAATDNLSTLFPNERERTGQGRDFEQKVIEHVNQRIDHYLSNLKNFEEKIEDYNEKFSRDIATDIRTLENRMSEFIDRAEGRHSGGRGFNEAGLESIKEELYQKIEFFMDELKNTASMVDVEELKTLIEKESMERREAVEKIEEYIYINDKRSSTLREDMSHKIEEFEVLLKRGAPSQAEDGQYASSFPEQKFMEDIHKLQRAVKDLNARVGHSSPSDNYRSVSGSVDISSRNAMDELEKRIADNMVDGFDRFSNIVRKHMEKSKKLDVRVNELNERVTILEDNLPSRSRSRSRAAVKKQTSNNIYIDDQEHKDFLSTKDNPFLKGRLSSATRINSHGNTSSPKNMEIEANASFGRRSKKVPFGISTNFSDDDDDEDLKNGSRNKKKSLQRSGKKSRSRSASKSLSSSIISNPNGKESKSPARKKNYESTRLASNSKRSRKASPSASATATPKRRNSVKSQESFGSRRSPKRGVLESSNKKSNIKQMQNKIEMERKLREEKIKKLIKKSKPTTNTPKFSGKEQNVGGTKSNKENNPNAASKSFKSMPKSTNVNDSFDRSLKYDYNFTTKGEKQFSSTQKDSKKYQKLDELYNKNASRKNE